MDTRKWISENKYKEMYKSGKEHIKEMDTRINEYKEMDTRINEYKEIN